MKFKETQSLLLDSYTQDTLTQLSKKFNAKKNGYSQFWIYCILKERILQNVAFLFQNKWLICPDQPTVPGCNTNSYSTCFTKDYYSNTIM